MESNNYESFIADTVEAMLPRFSDPKLTLVMRVGLKWNYYPSSNQMGLMNEKDEVQEEKSFSKSFLIVFQRPNNYTKVLVLDDSDHKIKSMDMDKEPIQFNQYSDHDSCWRSDGFSWMFESFVEAWDYFDQFGIEGRKVDPMVHWDIFGGKPSYWMVESLETVDGLLHWITDYVIKFDKKISLQEACEYMPKKEK